MIATKPSDLRWKVGPLPEPQPNLVIYAWVQGDLGNFIVKAFGSEARGERTWAFGDHVALERVGEVVWWAVARDEPYRGFVPLARQDEDASMAELLEKITNEGGCLLAVTDCSEGEVAAARARGDYCHNYRRGLSFVRRLPAWLQEHSKFARAARADGCGR